MLYNLFYLLVCGVLCVMIECVCISENICARYVFQFVVLCLYLSLYTWMRGCTIHVLLFDCVFVYCAAMSFIVDDASERRVGPIMLFMFVLLFMGASRNTDFVCARGFIRIICRFMFYVQRSVYCFL